LRLRIGRDQNFFLSELNSGGATQQKEFGLLVRQPGSYPIRLVYYSVDGSGLLEWSAFNRDGKPILGNDRNQEQAIRVHAMP